MRLRDPAVSDNTANDRKGLKTVEGESGRIERTHRTTFIMVAMMTLTSRIVIRVPLCYYWFSLLLIIAGTDLYHFYLNCSF